MRMCRVAEPSARANVGIDDNVQETGRFPRARIVRLEISTEHRGALMVGDRSTGRTSGFGPDNGGSSPPPRADALRLTFCYLFRHERMESFDVNRQFFGVA